MEIEIIPYVLRPYPTETLNPHEPFVKEAWKRSILPKAKQLGIKMKLPNIAPQPHTNLAFEGYHLQK